jgi:hypothetical protein
LKLFGFLEPAQIEFEKAINFYNQRRPNLGDEFAAEVLNTINRILNHPGPGQSFQNARGVARPTASPMA